MQAQGRVSNSRERYNLRLSEAVVRAIDQARVERPEYAPYNSWIAEAVSDERKGDEIDLYPRAWTPDDA
jgi:hypothetical protein